MPDEALVPPAGITCVRCLEHGHQMKAIEYVQSEDGQKLEPLCCFHRDSDPCPGCVARDKDAAVDKVYVAVRKQTAAVAVEDLADFQKQESTVDPLEKVGVSISEALKLFKQGMSNRQIAAHFKVPKWRFDQSSAWTMAKKGVDRSDPPPAPPKERKPYVRKAVQSERRQGDRRRPIRATLLDVKAEIEAHIADLKEVLKSCDLALERYPE